jgi:hypothetical protein
MKNPIFKEILKTLRTYSLKGTIRYLFLKIRGRELVVRGQCVGCGKCCQKLSLEGSNGWLRSMDDFTRICKDRTEFRRFSPNGKDSQGFLIFSCDWCTTEGKCTNYEQRLQLCKDFPDKGLLFCGGSLPEGCGFRFEIVKPFRGMLKKEMEKVYRDNGQNTHR